MSSIMRRRNGLMLSSLMGYACLSRGLLTPRSSDRSIRPVIALPSVPATTLRAALYRASGFVLWPECEVPTYASNVGSPGNCGRDVLALSLTGFDPLLD